MEQKSLLKKGDIIMLVGFGAGLTYGATLIRW
jgi:3-oxoacyl-[acyl-carrier-protein] synthase-3